MLILEPKFHLHVTWFTPYFKTDNKVLCLVLRENLKVSLLNL